MVKKKLKERGADRIKLEAVERKASNFDLNEEMAKCREREMAAIRKNVALLKYYNCMVALFMIAYTSSQVLASNFFQPQRRTSCLPNLELPNQFGINFLALLVRAY